MENIPTHLAFIVDGNRRWAKERGLPTLEGHKAGFALVETIAEDCFRRGIKFVSFYLFSTENWDRSQEEVSYLMALAKAQISRLAKKLEKNNIKLAVLGSRDRVEKSLLKSIDAAKALTASGTKGTLGICFNYGGRQEIADALQKITESNPKGTKITPDLITANLYHPEIPDADMIVRTSGEERISGFMLWRASYAEFLFLKKYWPEMSPADVADILAKYASRHRRFGK